MMDEETLNKLHSVLLEILEYVTKICNENNLTYVLLGGTALGAVRHHGFIPWDDDIDIGMPRKDYEKLIKILSENDNEYYCVQNEDNEKNYFYPFTKVRKNDTIFKENVKDKNFNNEGIFIDIFPIDYLEEPKNLRTRVRATYIKYLSHVLRVKNCKILYKEKKIKYIINIISILPMIFVNNKKILQIQRKNMIKENNSNKIKYFVIFSDIIGWEKTVYPIDVFFPTKLITFENKKLSVFANVDKYLTQAYGDYWKLPPKDKRIAHKPEVLTF